MGKIWKALALVDARELTETGAHSVDSEKPGPLCWKKLVSVLAANTHEVSSFCVPITVFMVEVDLWWITGIVAKLVFLKLQLLTVVQSASTVQLPLANRLVAEMPRAKMLRLLRLRI